MVANKVLGTAIGAMVGAGVAVVPSIVYITQNTNGTSGPNEAIVATLMFGPIITGGIIGFSIS
jgi:hypothetical protein